MRIIFHDIVVVRIFVGSASTNSNIASKVNDTLDMKDSHFEERH